ncbi:MAG: c-type cytochrome, partial [Phaeodactylibacter sp.]|nr:c-type cytochrome [Phaeodactylibacter sp.]
MKNQWLKYIVSLTLLLPAVALLAQDAGGSDGGFFYNRFFSSLLLGVAALVVLFALGTLYRLLAMMIKVQQIRIYQENGLEEFLKEAKKPQPSPLKGLIQRWAGGVPVEKEADVLLDHDYDGIRELDNNLPPWWVAMFYITIFFAVVYFSYYHIFDIGLSSTEAYEQEMKAAEKDVAQYLANQADLVDETNVTAVEDETGLKIGQTIFNTNCVACHGMGGEGGVGPNLTDDYWIHGGGIKNVFKTIKYGVPEKGMIAWKAQLGAGDMQKVASYILTLHGTNPPNAKEPQGELYQEEQADLENETTPPADSTETTTAEEGT